MHHSFTKLCRFKALGSITFYIKQPAASLMDVYNIISSAWNDGMKLLIHYWNEMQR